MDEDINFCPHCGKDVKEGMPYCPACGVRLNDPYAEKVQDETAKKNADGKVNIAVVLILLYSVPLILISLWLYFAAAGAVADIYGDPAYADTIQMLTDVGYTQASFTGLIEILCLAGIIFGAIGLVPAVLAFKRRFWTVTIIFCLVSAILCALSIFGIIMGLIAFYMLYKAKPAFRD